MQAGRDQRRRRPCASQARRRDRVHRPQLRVGDLRFHRRRTGINLINILCTLN